MKTNKDSDVKFVFAKDWATQIAPICSLPEAELIAFILKIQTNVLSFPEQALTSLTLLQKETVIPA